jgi:hypothetical protein
VRYWRLVRKTLRKGNLSKLRKKPTNRGAYQPSRAPPENANVLFPQRNWGAVPLCTLVSGPDDPTIGGGRFGAMTPFRKLYNLSDRVCPRQMTKASGRRFRKGVRRLFRVNQLANFFSQLLYISFLERFVGLPC